MPNPRHRVTGPTFTPYPFGLLSVAQVVDDSDPHWRNGIEWEDLCAPAARATVAPCTEVLDPDGDGPDDLIEPEIPAKVGSDDRGGILDGEGPAVTLYATHLCSSGGRTTGQDRDRAGMLLTNGEGRGLEAVFQTGVTEAGVLPYSLNAAALAPIPFALPLREAFASIETAVLAATGGVGVIHANPVLVSLAIAERIVVRNGARLETVLGTPVAAGAGYALAGPDGSGEDEGVGWVYGTGPVVVYRGDVVTLEGFDRSVNDRTVIAERTYAYGWNCAGVFAVAADMSSLMPPPEPEE